MMRRPSMLPRTRRLPPSPGPGWAYRRRVIYAFQRLFRQVEHAHDLEPAELMALRREPDLMAERAHPIRLPPSDHGILDGSQRGLTDLVGNLGEALMLKGGHLTRILQMDRGASCSARQIW